LILGGGDGARGGGGGGGTGPCHEHRYHALPAVCRCYCGGGSNPLQAERMSVLNVWTLLNLLVRLSVGFGLPNIAMYMGLFLPYSR
jgi:hypothetical protein